MVLVADAPVSVAARLLQLSVVGVLLLVVLTFESVNNKEVPVVRFIAFLALM